MAKGGLWRGQMVMQAALSTHMYLSRKVDEMESAFLCVHFLERNSEESGR